MISPGKLRRLRSLTDAQGRFKMMAIDQRGSLVSAIARALGKADGDVSHQELEQAKRSVTKVLAPYATAVLTDPQYGYPQSLPYLAPQTGLLLASEESGYLPDGTKEGERRSTLIEGWSAAETLKAGADAVKLLAYYHPQGSPEVCRHQQELVVKVGKECDDAGVPFLLELVTYPLGAETADSAQVARAKPKLTIDSAREFSDPRYRVDVLKLEFPADLKWTKEYCNGAFDGKERQAVYSLDEVNGFCRRLDEASGLPWVILSAGVDIAEFLVQLELAIAAGASGFLCGRAIWQDAIGLFPDVTKVESWLAHHGVYNLTRANGCAGQALPWVDHRRFAAATFAS